MNWHKTLLVDFRLSKTLWYMMDKGGNKVTIPFGFVRLDPPERSDVYVYILFILWLRVAIGKDGEL